MDAILVPILIAAAVALFTLGVSSVARAFLHGEKRKLAERLSIDARFDPEAASARAIKIQRDQSPQPLAAEFRQCYDQHSLGQSLDEALKDTAARVESTDFAFFVTAVLIQRQTGGDLSEVLKNISGMIRGRVRLQQQVKAKTAEGRFTGYILVAFPAVMFLIVSFMNPEYARNLTGTT